MTAEPSTLEYTAEPSPLESKKQTVNSILHFRGCIPKLIPGLNIRDYEVVVLDPSTEICIREGPDVYSLVTNMDSCPVVLVGPLLVLFQGSEPFTF